MPLQRGSRRGCGPPAATLRPSASTAGRPLTLNVLPLLLLLLLLPGLLGGLGSGHTTAAEGQASLIAMVLLLLPFAPQLGKEAAP